MHSKMISMKEIIELIDKEFNFAQDPLVRELLQKSDIPEKQKHLVEEKNVLRYFERYAEDRDYDYYRDIIHLEGGTSATKYDKEDVLKCIKDAHISTLIERLLKKKTIPHTTYGIVPRVIIPNIIEYIHEHDDDRTKRILNLTGYTQQQLKLLSVFDDDLVYLKEQDDIYIDYLEQEIDQLKENLSNAKTERNDIAEELKSRGIIV